MRLRSSFDQGNAWKKDVATVEATVAVPGQQLDARVATLVRMLISKGRASMLAEALDEFAAICIPCWHCMRPHISLCLLQLVLRSCSCILSCESC